MATVAMLKEDFPTVFSPSIFFIFFIFFLVLLLKLSSKSKRNFNLPPCPPKLPLIGNLHQISNLPHISLHRLSQKFGPIILLQLGQIPTLVISSAKLAKEALKTHDLAFASRPFIFSAKHLFYNCTDIAFSSYGPYWRHIRKICILELLSSKRVQSYSFVREEEVSRLIHRISEASSSCTESTVDLSRFLGMYANDVLCRMAFGRDFSGGGEYDVNGFQKLLEEYQVLLGGFSFGDFFPSMEFIHSLTGMKSRLVSTFKRFDALFNQIINEHMNPERRREENKDLVDVLLDVQKNGSDDVISLTMDNVKAIILDMFAAGTDTTFITLDWGMTELIINPKVMKTAQNEIRSIMGDKQVVSEKDIVQMPYLKAVIKEILRLHPPVPVLVPRESMEDVTINNFFIPAKTRIFINVWAIGRDSESWKNPEKFEPERFLGSDIDFRGQDFELIPFGAGRRICPALSMGIATVEIVLAQLLHSFDWELPSGVKSEDLDMSEVFGITMHKIAHLNVTAKPRF